MNLQWIENGEITHILYDAFISVSAISVSVSAFFNFLNIFRHLIIIYVFQVYKNTQ